MAVQDDLDALAERTLQLAIVAQRLDERSEEAVRATERSAAELSGVSKQLAVLGERIAADAAQLIAREAAAQARHAVDAAFGQARSAMDAHVHRMHELDAAVHSSCGALARGHRRWLAVAPALLIIGCALAVVGTSAWVAQARFEVTRHAADTATLRALAAADIVRCGTALCARIDRRAAAPPGYVRVTARRGGP